MGSLVIVTSHWKEDLNWLRSSPFPVVLIDKEGSDPSCFEPSWVIPNRGCEITVYFKYIIENYDDLPDHVAFIHGHETQYHQRHEKHFMDVIKGANRKKYGYIPLNNEFRIMNYMDHPPEPDPNIIPIQFSTWWKKFKIPVAKPDDGRPILVDKSPQFIVSREKLRSVPKDVYQHWYDTLMAAEGREMGGYIIFFENIFSWIYGSHARLEQVGPRFMAHVPPDMFDFDFRPTFWTPESYMAPPPW